MKYLVTNATGDKARFQDEEEAIAFAKKRSKADSGAFTWRVVFEKIKHVSVADIRYGKLEVFS